MASAAPEIPVLARDQAFETLYRRHVADVYHYALALLRNPADAEDVTQTTFMNAYRAFKRGDEILKPQNWLIKIAHNVARTRYARASRRVKEVPLEDHLEQLALPEEDRPNVEAVLGALGRLPFNQRAALVMRELEGRTYAEIADTLGVSVAAVETLIFRARRSLRLRASALRTLAAVPLPGSLAQLFEGGVAVTGGGGALAGAGLLVKTLIAVVAGAVATGVGGGDIGPATAAPPAGVTLTIAQASAGGNGLKASRAHAAAVKGVKTAAQQGGTGVTATGSRLAAAEVAAGNDVRSNVSRGEAGPDAVPQRTATTEHVTKQVASVAGSLVDTAVSAASTAPVKAPNLPAAPPVPPVPSVPAQLPLPPPVRLPPPPPTRLPPTPPPPRLPLP